MFGNNNSGCVPVVADIANGGAFGGGNVFEDIIALAIVASMFGWNNGGGIIGGGNRAAGVDSAYATVGDVQRGFNQQSTDQQLSGIANGISQLGYSMQQQAYDTASAISAAQTAQQQCCCDMQQAIAQAQNALTAQLADCCCENRLAVANLNATLASDTCVVTTAIANAARDITDNQNANYRALHDEIVANRMEDKDAQIQQLQSQVQALNLAQSQANQNAYLVGQLKAPSPIPAYTVPNPYASYGCCAQACC